ncbi:MAG: DEAD/DEAH box helicase [Planctomycetota bacterium]
MSFESLGLSQPVLRGIRKAGYDAPTDIQVQAIPPALESRHLIALGQTGSGKTAAFGLPILERLLTAEGEAGEPGLRAVILVPTRELCVQVAENLRIYAEFTGLHVRTAFGGIGIGIQEAAFRRGLDVLVACPGRLIDHLSCGNVTLDRVTDFVLDEADRMLDMGFMPQIRRIVAHLPQVRRNGLFSATMPPEIEKLVKEHFEGAVRIQVGSRSQAATTIVHRFESLSPQQKERNLVQMLEARDDTVILFVKTKKRAEELGRKLKAARLPADSLHGDKSAEQRHVVLKGFASRRLRFLVATDVAARGIDISNVGLVVNFDMPHALEDYIHRVGRTGRAGKEGEAVTYVGRMDRSLCEQIVKHLAKSSDGLARVLVDGEERVAPMAKDSKRSRSSEERSESRPRSRKESDRDSREDRDSGRRRRRTSDRESEREESPQGSRGGRDSKKRESRRASAAAVSLGASVSDDSNDSFGFGAGVDEAGDSSADHSDRKRSRSRRTARS